MTFSWLKRSRVKDDEDESITDVLERTPAVWDVKEDQLHIVARPSFHPNPPSRHGRPELHMTGPNPTPRPYVKRAAPRLSFGARLRQSRDLLPLFHQTAKVVGWRGLIPPPKPSVTATAAMRSIEAHYDKTIRTICSAHEQARAELWERARDYDMREAEFRAKRPLAITRGM